MVLVWFLPGFAYAQPGQETQVQIIKSDRAIVDIQEGRDTRYLAGNVRLFHRDAFVLCDSAIVSDQDIVAYGQVTILQDDTIQAFADSLRYKGDVREAQLFGQVVLRNGRQKMYSQQVDYNLQSKVATYNRRSILTDDQTKIVSNSGRYEVNTADAYFKDSVLVTDPAFGMKTDTMRFNTRSKTAFFLAPTLIVQDSTKIYCAGGSYNTETGAAEFVNNPQYQKGTDKATADTIRVNRSTGTVWLVGKARAMDANRTARANSIRFEQKTGDTFLEGQAYYKDKSQEATSDTIRYNTETKKLGTRGRSKVSLPPQIIEADALDYDNGSQQGSARGAVVVNDTSANFTLRCAAIDYNRAQDSIMAWGDRPLITTPLDNDSFYMRADTILAFRRVHQTDSLAVSDTSRVVQGFRNVRMFSASFRGVTDSVEYINRDSVFVFTGRPLMWSDSSQFSADTIRMYLRDRKADRMTLHRNAFVVNLDGPEQYNQTRGQFIEALFADGAVDQAYVDGNAESLYYVRDDGDNSLMGINRTSSGSLRLFFKDGQVSDIRLYQAPTGNMTPLKQVPAAERLLRGFFWQYEKRPMGPFDI
jgi:lipopolysaccharide export system protein LptA